MVPSAFAHPSREGAQMVKWLCGLPFEDHLSQDDYWPFFYL